MLDDMTSLSLSGVTKFLRSSEGQSLVFDYHSRWQEFRILGNVCVSIVLLSVNSQFNIRVRCRHPPLIKGVIYCEPTQDGDVGGRVFIADEIRGAIRTKGEAGRRAQPD